MILGIDTATDQASVALVRDGEVLVECSWRARGQHSNHLARVLREVWLLAGAKPNEVTAVAVARGPGSFNGIRVGLSLAQGLALGLGVPLVGIATLDVIAWQAARAGTTVWALLPAGRGEIFAACYTGEGSEWRRTGEYRRMSPAGVVAEYQPVDVLAGSGASAVADLLADKTGGVRVNHEALRRAGYLAELGRRTLEAEGHAGERGTEVEVRPLYLRRSSAEERRAAGSGTE